MALSTGMTELTMECLLQYACTLSLDKRMLPLQCPFDTAFGDATSSGISGPAGASTISMTFQLHYAFEEVPKQQFKQVLRQVLK